MPGYVIDRREQHRDKSSTSRDRFIKRYHAVIKKAAADTVKRAKGFRDLTTGKDGQEHEITIDRKSLDEPQFTHGKGGQQEHIFGDNSEYNLGDLIPRPQDGGGGGNEGSPDGEGEDAFTFYLDREEFLRLILDDLALPDMIKKNLTYSVIAEYVHAGFTKQGSPGTMDVMRSFKQSLSRRIGLHRADHKKKLEELEAELQVLMLKFPDEETRPADIREAVQALQDEIDALKRRLKVMPFFDPNNDMRYRLRELERKPSVSAVMFCIMDVSGSMTENMKMNAKYFYFLLHLFLKKNYNHVDVVFIRHTSHAEEVSEEVFFYDRETGGTVVSSALELTNQIIADRYDPSIWNIYIAQASDGDNYGADTQRCVDILQEKLLKLAQYMVYVEMSDSTMNFWRQHGFASNSSTDLWKAYEQVAQKHQRLKMKSVGDKSEIYPVFRELFEKKSEHVS